MKFPWLLLALGAFTGCATPVATVTNKATDPNIFVLKAGQSAILSAGQTAKVPFGSSVLSPGGGSITLYGHFNTVNTVGGAIVSVPINAPGASDNAVIAASVSLHDPDPNAKQTPAATLPSTVSVPTAATPISHGATPTPTTSSAYESRINALREGQQRVLADRSWIAPFVRTTYGPVVEGLKIEATTKKKLLDLLAERKLAMADANQLYWRTVEAARRVNPTAKIPSDNDHDVAQQQAADKAEGEIKALVDAENYAKVTMAGVVVTVAGKNNVIGSVDGLASAARFNYPSGVAVDGAGGLVITDSANHCVRRLSLDGTVTTVAGRASVGSNDGPAAQARFYGPTGVVSDGLGNGYVADRNNHVIRRLAADGTVTTVAGAASESGSADGVGAAARFNLPAGIARDRAGNLYVADSGNHSIRKISAAGIVSTLAGQPGVSGSADGTATEAQFNYPTGIAVDHDGNIYVADRGNGTIRKITASGVATTLAGKALAY